MNPQANQWQNQHGTDSLAIEIDAYAEAGRVIKIQTDLQKDRRGVIVATFKERDIKQYATRLHVAKLKPTKGVFDGAVATLTTVLAPDVLEQVTERSTTVEILEKAVKKGIITREIADQVINLNKSERLEIE